MFRMVDDAEVNFRGRSLIVSRVAGRTWLAVAFLAASVAFIAVVMPSFAKAEETVWICKPGQADDLCAGSISTKDAGTNEPFGFERTADPKVDCFYIYPTVSSQDTPNANLDKDPEVKRVVVQQARMFSRVCDVYAPMYRQDTSPGVYTERTEVAYQSALSGWKDYLENYNNGRGFILLGHSQGAATVARLIDEEIDPDPALRNQMVGAILPGANIHVKKGQLTGGMFENVPACSKMGEYGCLVAFSTFKGEPADNPPFSDLGSGYWAYDMPRPSSDEYEVVCTNPTVLSGQELLTPLANMDYLQSPPDNGVESAFWISFPNSVSASCQREGTKHWLNVDLTTPINPLLSLIVQETASGNNWHVPEVNMAENNLVEIAQLQADNYTTEQVRIERLNKKVKELQKQLAKAQKHAQGLKAKANKLAKQARKAKGKRKQALQRKAKTARKKAASERKRAASLKKRIAGLKKQI